MLSYYIATLIFVFAIAALTKSAEQKVRKHREVLEDNEIRREGQRQRRDRI